MTKWIKILTSIGSLISIGFGVWHFFVPKIWNWYAYFDKTATELLVAVRAINVLFSLILILLGVANLLIVFKSPQDRFSVGVVLSLSTILWITRSVLQTIYPQGTNYPALQYGMLVIFLLVLACFAISLFLLLIRK